METTFSWIVTILGLIGFWLAGRKVWWCWYINILNQVAWAIFAIITEYYAFLVATAFYFIVFSKNAYQWTTEHFDKPLIEGIDKLVTDYQAQYQDPTPYLTGHWCGNIHGKTRLACSRGPGHEELHGYAGVFWTDGQGEYTDQFRGKVL